MIPWGAYAQGQGLHRKAAHGSRTGSNKRDTSGQRSKVGQRGRGTSGKDSMGSWEVRGAGGKGSVRTGGGDNTGDGLASQPRCSRMPR